MGGGGGAGGRKPAATRLTPTSPYERCLMSTGSAEGSRVRRTVAGGQYTAGTWAPPLAAGNGGLARSPRPS